MTVSVIIPAYNEEDIIAETIKAVQAHGGQYISEILVVDGESTDRTVSEAENAGANVITAPRKGRAAQMNFGGKQATGDILYFLHADTVPPAGFADSIRRAILAGHEAGCFRLSFDESHFLLNWYAWFTRFDIDAFRFGDQSLFIRQTAFWAIDGFRNDHLVMEDNEIIRRIKQSYSFVILEDAVETSARMYREVGIVKLQLFFVLIYTLYFLGVEQETLAKIKRDL